MRRRLLVLLPALALAAATYGQGLFSSWNDIQFSKSWTDAYASLRVENRTSDCWFVRPMVGYRLAPWLRGDVAYDYLRTDSDVDHHRALFSLTATARHGLLTASVRERYVFDLTRDRATRTLGNPSQVLRSQLKVQCDVPDMPFTPYVALELFTWERWQKTRHYVGTLVALNAHHAVDFYYLYYTSAGSEPRHIFGVGYNYSF